MKKLVLFLWLSVTSVGALGFEKAPPSFSPLIYQSLSPKFCFQHLQQFPKECSEQAIDEAGSFYDPFPKGQPVSFHFDVIESTGEQILTSWAKIHYAKDGVHIVPTLPRG